MSKFCLVSPLILGLVGILLSGCGGDEPATSTTTIAPTSAPDTRVAAAWANHLAAFGDGVSAGKINTTNREAALEKILLDYTNDSIVRVSSEEGVNTSHGGLTAIRGLFEQLFMDLDGCNDNKTGNLMVKDLQTDENPYGEVLLVWQCVSAGFERATDTFIFNGDKIMGQNIVLEQTSQSKSEDETTLQFSEARRLTEYNPTSVEMAWTNHLNAFLGRDVDSIMLDYDDDSLVRTYEWTGASSVEYSGKAAIQNLFNGIFDRLGRGNETVDVNRLHLEVVERANENSVFLVWNAKEATPAYLSATDTFIFGTDFKIKKQNIVTVSGAMGGLTVAI